MKTNGLIAKSLTKWCVNLGHD